MADQEQRARESEREPDDKFHQARDDERAERAEESSDVQDELQPRDDDAA